MEFGQCHIFLPEISYVFVLCQKPGILAIKELRVWPTGETFYLMDIYNIYKTKETED